MDEQTKERIKLFQDWLAIWLPLQGKSGCPSPLHIYLVCHAEEHKIRQCSLLPRERVAQLTKQYRALSPKEQEPFLAIGKAYRERWPSTCSQRKSFYDAMLSQVFDLRRATQQAKQDRAAAKQAIENEKKTKRKLAAFADEVIDEVWQLFEVQHTAEGDETMSNKRRKTETGLVQIYTVCVENEEVDLVVDWGRINLDN